MDEKISKREQLKRIREKFADIENMEFPSPEESLGFVSTGSEEDLDDEDLFDESTETGEDERYEHFALEIDKGQSTMRIDKFLTNRIEGSTRNRIQTAIDKGNVLVDGVAVKANYKIKPLERVTIVLAYPRQEVAVLPEDIPLDIVYEDDHVIVLNKPAGLVVHPGHGNYAGTLVNALAFHLRDLPMFQSGDMRAGVVHRLDKNTTGLMVVAKSTEVHKRLAKQFFDRTVERRYVALVWGSFEEESGRIEGNIGRNVRDKLKMCVFPDESAGKEAITNYWVLRQYGYVSLVECKLETGRTHQIRVHMEHIGHPLFNDDRYGGNRILRGTTFAKYQQFVENCFKILPRQALHARSIGFTHPVTNEKMHFESPLPDDMQQVLDKWEVYSTHKREEK